MIAYSVIAGIVIVGAIALAVVFALRSRGPVASVSLGNPIIRPAEGGVLGGRQ